MTGRRNETARTRRVRAKATLIWYGQRPLGELGRERSCRKRRVCGSAELTAGVRPVFHREDEMPYFFPLRNKVRFGKGLCAGICEPFD